MKISAVFLLITLLFEACCQGIHLRRNTACIPKEQASDEELPSPETLNATIIDPRAQDVLDFWFQEVNQSWWFGSPDNELDDIIRQRFGQLNSEGRDFELDHWRLDAKEALALTLLLDQFNRNLYRGTPEMYTNDEYCQRLCLDGIMKGYDVELIESGGDAKNKLRFFLLPLMHAEDLKLQDLLLEKMEEFGLGDEYGYDYALYHRDDIARFGRFPSRNEILNRTSTPEETEYLNDPNAWFN